MAYRTTPWRGRRPAQTCAALAAAAAEARAHESEVVAQDVEQCRFRRRGNAMAGAVHFDRDHRQNILA